MFGLSDRNEIITLALFVMIQYQSVTDIRTDRHLCSSNTSVAQLVIATAALVKR